MTLDTPTDDQIEALKRAAQVFYTLKERMEDFFIDQIKPTHFTNEDGVLDMRAYAEKVGEVRSHVENGSYLVNIGEGENTWQVNVVGGVEFETRRRLRTINQQK